MRILFDKGAGGSEYTRSVLKYSKNMIYVMLLGSALTFMGNKVWSHTFTNSYLEKDNADKVLIFNQKNGSSDDPHRKNSNVANDKNSYKTDECLPLLSSIREQSSLDAMDRIAQRNAGKAAALGLFVGVRFALAPTNVSEQAVVRGRQMKKQLNNRNALAVKAYRQCQKERALQSLNDMKWTR